jgi:hypothetical protein
MHSYSTDSSERRVVPLLLALLAIALAWVSSKFLAAAHLSAPWWVDAPATMTSLLASLTSQNYKVLVLKL